MAETNEPTYISKMSVKGLGCNPKAVGAMEDENGKAAVLPLCDVYGKADSLKHGEDKSGSIWTALSGNFEGRNLKTGEVFRSGKLFLPGGIQEVIEKPIADAEKEEKEITIAFALRISAVKASNPIGYSYQAMSMIPPQETDALAEIRNALSAREQKMLAAGSAATQEAPAPATQEAPAPAPAPKAAGKPRK